MKRALIAVLAFLRFVLRSVREKANEDLKVWHLVVCLMIGASIAVDTKADVERHANEIRQEMYEAQASQTKMIAGGLKVLGIDIKDIKTP